MAVEDDALAAWSAMQSGPGNEYVAQQGREPLSVPGYSPHQLNTGGGLPPAGAYVDPTPTAPQPAVESVPNQADNHPGTHTLGRRDA